VLLYARFCTLAGLALDFVSPFLAMGFSLN
jgi:hypothetical protein